MTSPRRGIGYARVSVIVDDSTAIPRQLADIRDIARREGIDLVDILVDDGFSGRKARANADRAIAMLAAGDVDSLIVWKLDRLTRGGVGALVPLFEALERTPAAGQNPPLFLTVDGHRSDGTAWRIIATVLAEVARAEVENISARAASAVHYRRTVTHRFVGGAAVPFGYQSVPAPDGVGRVLTPDPAESALVQEMAERVLAGWSAGRVARDLNARNVPTSKSAFRRAARGGEPDPGADRGTWTGSTVRTLLVADTLAGRQKHRGALVRDQDGLPAEVWPPVLSIDTLARLRDTLATPGAPAPRGRAARLLSGVAYCAHCHGKMFVTTSGGRPIYACGSGWNTHRDGERCPSPKIDAARFEAFVSDRVLHRNGSRPEVVRVVASANPEAAAEIVEVEAALAVATEALSSDDDVDVAAVMARITALRERRGTLRALAGERAEVAQETGRTVANAWDADEDPEARRGLVQRVVRHIAVARAAYPSAPPASRVDISWLIGPDGLDHDETNSTGPRGGERRAPRRERT